MFAVLEKERGHQQKDRHRGDNADGDESHKIAVEMKMLSGLAVET